eukprot:SAG11_NODE_6416_length_1318_cov_2.427400_1_plen_92_part_00
MHCVIDPIHGNGTSKLALTSSEAATVRLSPSPTATTTVASSATRKVTPDAVKVAPELRYTAVLTVASKESVEFEIVTDASVGISIAPWKTG